MPRAVSCERASTAAAHQRVHVTTLFRLMNKAIPIDDYRRREPAHPLRRLPVYYVALALRSPRWLIMARIVHGEIDEAIVSD